MLVLKETWQRSLDVHGDDSSDEEESEFANRFQYINFKNIDISQGIQKAFSAIVHKTALFVYNSKEVNSIYYKLKTSHLSGNVLKIEEADIERWVRLLWQKLNLLIISL